VKKKRYIIKGTLAADFAVSVLGTSLENATEQVDEFTIDDFKNALVFDMVVDQETIEEVPVQ
jgi:hypothetical protein